MRLFTLAGVFDKSFWTFLVVVVLLCGGGAFVTGKAIAETWRPFWQVVLYAAMLAGVSRFLHYALFHLKMMDFTSYIVEFIVIFVLAAMGYTLARRRQMATQYGWTERT
jgi:hypothetical protein